MNSILLLNGPNLNRLGKREPGIYGNETLDDIEKSLKKMLAAHNVSMESFQSNHEGELIDKIHQSEGNQMGIIFNPGAYTHTSIAIRDAISSVDVPVIEVHISNVHARESFRHHSLLAAVSQGQIVGLGTKGYELAAEYFVSKLQER